MNLDIKVISKKLIGLLKKLTKYASFIVFVLVLLAYSFVVFRIRILTSHEPDDEVVTERLRTLNRPKLDQDTVNKIQQLQDTNVQVKTLFDQARDNPFQN
jgi:hypothetical protein